MMTHADERPTPPLTELATSLVTRRPKAERVAEFEQVLSNTISAVQAFPGHLGVTVLKPSESGFAGYRIVVKFDSESSLRTWHQSPEAKQWFAKLAALEEAPAVFDQVTGLEAWFELPVSAGEGTRLHAPQRHKMLLATWLGSFPTISVLIWILWPVIGGWPLLVRTAVLSGLMVALLTYVVMPALVRWLRRWLFSPPTRDTGSR